MIIQTFRTLRHGKKTRHIKSFSFLAALPEFSQAPSPSRLKPSSFGLISINSIKRGASESELENIAIAKTVSA